MKEPAQLRRYIATLKNSSLDNDQMLATFLETYLETRGENATIEGVLRALKTVLRDTVDVIIAIGRIG